MMGFKVLGVSIALGLACGGVPCLVERLFAQERKVSRATSASKRMADGKEWTSENLDVVTVPSYCYDNAESNCRLYGRLYTWEAARRGCESLGEGWRLPTNDEWRQMAMHYGGLLEDSKAAGETAYKELLNGGSSGFNALLGGGRSDQGEYARVEAHGFYWTASESGEGTAWFYNFGKGIPALGRLSDGEKQRAFSVRCVRD